MRMNKKHEESGCGSSCHRRAHAVDMLLIMHISFLIGRVYKYTSTRVPCTSLCIQHTEVPEYSEYSTVYDYEYRYFALLDCTLPLLYFVRSGSYYYMYSESTETRIVSIDYSDKLTCLVL